MTVLNDNCEDCTCVKDGVVHCKPRVCPTCAPGMHTQLTLDCTCICKDCEPGTRLCPTSQTCVPLTNWCDGVEHCPDDEQNCTQGTACTEPNILIKTYSF